MGGHELLKTGTNVMLTVGKGLTVKRRRGLIDNALGMAGVTTCLALALLLVKSVRAVILGPALLSRLAGLALSLVAAVVLPVFAYPAVLLLRHPSIRRTSAEEIARYAARNPEPLTPARGRLIVLSGLDGSGKSTHAEWISAALATRNEPHRIVWLRWVMLTSLPVLAYGRLRGHSRRHYNPRSQSTIVEPLYDRSRVMRSVWPRLFALDIALAAWWRVLRPLRRGETVVCDRYALDVVADIAAILQDDSLLRGRLASRLLTLLPPDAHTVVIDIDPEVAFARKRDVLDRLYLDRRRPLYLELARRTGATVVDGNASFEVVQQAIASAIDVRPPSRGRVLAHGAPR